MASVSQVGTGRRRVSKQVLREAIEGYLYILPWILGFLIFTLGPMIASFLLSLTNYNGLIWPPDFLGIQNYTDAFTKDKLYWLSLQRTTLYAVASVVLGVTGSLLAAVILDQRLKGTVIYRTLFFLPSLTPGVALALIWGWIFQPQIGILNYILRNLGVSDPPGWLASSDWSIWALLIMSLWAGIGGGRMIIFLAGLQGVPNELYEAAEIDGATAYQRFLNVTVPLLTPTIFFNLVLGVIGAFQVFTTAYIATGGGPANSTYFYVLNIFNEAFSYGRLGKASALAWIFFVILLFFTYVQLQSSRKWVYYEYGQEERT